MIFQINDKKKKQTTTSYTISKCVKCHTTKKQKFKKGDVVFAKTVHVCTSCDNSMIIEHIFSKELE